MECTHLLDNVKLDSDLFGEGSITKNFDCSECAIKEQNWLCLHCGVINCGRYANGHAMLHAETQDHQVCMSCDAYSVYCYKCDNYVSNEAEIHVIDKIRQNIMQLRDSENAEPNGNIEEIDNENIEEVPSPITTELDSSNKIDLSPSVEESDDVTPASSCEAPNIEPGVSESAECKTSKTNKITEEPVRSLDLTDSSTQTNPTTDMKHIELANEAFGTFIGREINNVPLCKRRFVMYQIIKLIENN